jgi:hypothetical protein
MTIIGFIFGHRLAPYFYVVNSSRTRHSVSGGFYKGFGERPAPCKYYVSLYAVFLSRRSPPNRRKGSAAVEVIGVRCVRFVSFAVR